MSNHLYKSLAKLNLGLKVLNKTSNGYHNINTVFCLIDIFDFIEINTQEQDGEVTLLNHTQDWPYNQDLAYRAATLFKEYTNISNAIDIKVTKNIPHGAGLGGGSSNAATVLLGLSSIFNCNIPIDTLSQLGSTLGADVPFFLYNRNAYAYGTGNLLLDVDIPLKYFVLIFPDIRCSTKVVFDYYDKINHEITANTVSANQLMANYENDLYEAACLAYPGLKILVKQLHQNLTQKIYMTGSGSTMFIEAKSLDEAKRVAKTLGGSYNTRLACSISSCL